MTIFSKILRREIPAQIEHEDDLCLAFRDIQPKAPTHILIIPKKEIRNLSEAKEEDRLLIGHLFLTAARLAATLGLESAGYRVTVNTGRDGGQTVSHLHLHLMGGRPFAWPPG